MQKLRAFVLILATFIVACASTSEGDTRLASEAATIWSGQCTDQIVFSDSEGFAFYYDAGDAVTHTVRMQVEADGIPLVGDWLEAPYVEVWDDTWTWKLGEGTAAEFTPSFAGQRVILDAPGAPLVQDATYWYDIARCAAAGGPGPSDFPIRVMAANTAALSPYISKEQLIAAFQAAGPLDAIIMNEPVQEIDVAGVLGLHVTNVEGTGHLPFQILTRWRPKAVLVNGVSVQPCRGVDIHIAGVHLPPYPYEPYDLAEDPRLTSEALISSANDTRGRQLDDMLASTINPLLERGAALILGGDFNEPSHLDWTPRALSSGVHGAVVEWPASKKLEELSLTDTYRALRPDEVAWPGDTWTPYPEREQGEIHDRIDYLYHSPALDPIDVQVVGESNATSDVVVEPYPSDHRFVVASYLVRGAHCQ